VRTCSPGLPCLVLTAADCPLPLPSHTCLVERQFSFVCGVGSCVCL
jgi:hypothetical protein